MSDYIMIMDGPTIESQYFLNRLREHDYYVISRVGNNGKLYAILSRKYCLPIPIKTFELSFPDADFYPLETDLITATHWINAQ